MASYTGLSPKGPRDYVGPNVYLSTVVTRDRRPTGADYRQPETGKLYPTSSFWLIAPNPTTGVQGELWYLSKIVANVAYWLMLSAGSSGPAINITVPAGVSPIVPDGTGTINFTSSAGTITITGSSAVPNNHTINFDLAGGGIAFDQIVVQAATAPGVSPVTPTAAGQLTFNGAAVAAHSVPVETRTRALNTINLEVQYSAAVAATDATKSGLAHFDSASFAVDANGFVTLLGGGLAIDSVAVQTGTSPVVPTAAGLLTINGAVVAAGTNPVRSDGTGANTLAIEVQISQALAATDATKIGLSNYSSADFTVDANGFVQAKGAIPAIGVKNLGISYSAGTFTVLGQDGTSLSASNPAYVVVPSRASPGLYTTFTVTANQSFTDSAGSNQIGNSLFGLTTAIAHASDIPFYIYFAADSSDANGTFFISRVPHRSTCPAAGNIGQSGNTNASTQGSFFALQAITAANFADQPCLCIGAFRMQYTGASWTVQTLSDGSTGAGTNKTADGIGCFHEGSKFNVATGQFGAAAGSFFLNNGGTAPAWASQSFSYTMNKAGLCNFGMSGATSSAGAGAVSALVALPLLSINTGGAPGTVLYSGAFGVCTPSGTNSTLGFIVITNTPTFTATTNADLAVAAFGAGFSYTADAG